MIKEAMACNLKIVSTKVGDVAHLIGNLEGCELINFDKKELLNSIERLLKLEKQPQGRDKIQSLSIDSESIRQKLINCYNG